MKALWFNSVIDYTLTSSWSCWAKENSSNFGSIIACSTKAQQDGWWWWYSDPEPRKSERDTLFWKGYLVPNYDVSIGRHLLPSATSCTSLPTCQVGIITNNHRNSWKGRLQLHLLVFSISNSRASSSPGAFRSFVIDEITTFLLITSSLGWIFIYSVSHSYSLWALQYVSSSWW